MFDSLKLYTGRSLDVGSVPDLLDKNGYSRCREVSREGDYSLIGEVFIIFPATFEYPVRVDIHDGVVRSIKSVDLLTFRTISEHRALILLPAGVIRKRSLKPRLQGTEGMPLDSFVDIEPGDPVVHVDYGIGKYLGLKRLRKGGEVKDTFVLEYSGGDRLYVESGDLDKIQRYVSFHKRFPGLDSLKGRRWESSRKSAARGASKVAGELLEFSARREEARGFAFSRDTEWQVEVERSFPYKETPDQIKATIEVKKDMESDRPMDRLLCGDVGYGKTEVALRAAFKAVMDGRQVAFLVPTTILAEQHTDTFVKRLKDFPVNVQMLNRFRTPSEQAMIKGDMASGKVDIVIGTHSLLSDDIKFKDLGLLIVDEEQRFGVKHKEKIKRLKINVDILTLTATPIPRTLYLSLMGARDMSLIETPPLKRMPVDTQLTEYDETVISEALKKEISRGGQAYYVHNRVESIDGVAAKISKLSPGSKVMAAHGQMGARLLEKTMLDFIKGFVDILVCTTIIESGIDIPNANTMIIDNADRYGLADLYQLRGRIGRFHRKAFAYLIVRDLTSVTREVRARLNAMVKYRQLGSGFKVAMNDLEMRGAGNILGIEQSGFIDRVGFDLYCRLLRDEIKKIRKSGRYASR